MAIVKHDYAQRITWIGITDKEACEMSKEKKWMDGDSPYLIGGRDTDISQIGYSLSHRLGEMLIEQFIEFVSRTREG